MLRLLFLLRSQFGLWGLPKHPLQLSINLIIKIILLGPIWLIQSIWLPKKSHLVHPLLLDLTYHLLFLKIFFKHWCEMLFIRLSLLLLVVGVLMGILFIFLSCCLKSNIYPGIELLLSLFFQLALCHYIFHDYHAGIP